MGRCVEKSSHATISFNKTKATLPIMLSLRLPLHLKCLSVLTLALGLSTPSLLPFLRVPKRLFSAYHMKQLGKTTLYCLLFFFSQTSVSVCTGVDFALSTPPQACLPTRGEKREGRPEVDRSSMGFGPRLVSEQKSLFIWSYSSIDCMRTLSSGSIHPL
jgi:hypothetical protein